MLHLLNDVLAREGRRILLFVLYVLQSTTVLITKDIERIEITDAFIFVVWK